MWINENLLKSTCDDVIFQRKDWVGLVISQSGQLCFCANFLCYKALRLEKSFKKFYGRYQDLIEKYRRSVNAMVSDSFPEQFLFNM